MIISHFFTFNILYCKLNCIRLKLKKWGIWCHISNYCCFTHNKALKIQFKCMKWFKNADVKKKPCGNQFISFNFKRICFKTAFRYKTTKSLLFKRDERKKVKKSKITSFGLLCELIKERNALWAGLLSCLSKDKWHQHRSCLEKIFWNMKRE